MITVVRTGRQAIECNEFRGVKRIIDYLLDKMWYTNVEIYETSGTRIEVSAENRLIEEPPGNWKFSGPETEIAQVRRYLSEKNVPMVDGT